MWLRSGVVCQVQWMGSGLVYVGVILLRNVWWEGFVYICTWRNATWLQVVGGG